MSVPALMAALATDTPALFAAVFKDRCSVQRVTRLDDGRGGWVETWAATTSAIPCAFVPYPAAKEIVIAGQVKGMADGDVWLPAIFESSALDVTEKDRLLIAASGLEPERALEIIFPAPHQGILTQAAVRLVNEPYVTNRQTDFLFDSVSPVSLGTIAAGKVLISITVHIQEEFDDAAATLSVGVEGDPDSLMGEAMIVPSQVEMFRVLIGDGFESDTELFLTITPGISTQGSGYVELEFDA